MKLILISSILLSGQALAFIPMTTSLDEIIRKPVPKVIYGETDDRLEPAEAQFINYNIENGKRATAALIHRYNLEEFDQDWTELYGRSLEDKLNVCPDERFTEQLTVSNCSGILVGPNLLLTASHCVMGTDKDFCKHYRWVFDYTSESDFVPSQSVYKCSAVLEKVYNRSAGIDWALIALDRIVEDRQPVNVNTSAKNPELDDTLVMMGYPSGLPLKITTNGKIREIYHNYIKTNFDSFTGNSGSPVFNQRTGDLEGVLIRGEEDYEYDRKSGCLRPAKCEKDGCLGEDITKVSAMYDLKKYIDQSFSLTE